MWPFKKVAVTPEGPLLGQWRVSRADGASLERYGDHAMTFTRFGELVYTDISDGEPIGRSLLVFRVEGQTLITDQPSSPREERTRFEIRDKKLLLGDPATTMIRERKYESDPLARALALGATAIEHGLDSANEDGRFVPFFMCELAKGRELYRFVTETPAEARQVAEQRFLERRHSIQTCAWVYDAYVTLEQQGKLDTVIAELSDRESPDGLLIAQPYRLIDSAAERVGSLQTQTERSWFAG